MTLRTFALPPSDEMEWMEYSKHHITYHHTREGRYYGHYLRFRQKTPTGPTVEFWMHGSDGAEPDFGEGEWITQDIQRPERLSDDEFRAYLVGLYKLSA